MPNENRIIEQTNILDRLDSIEWGVADVNLPGQTESGDQFIVKPFNDGALIGVVDGLGHGDQAAAAARLTTATLGAHAHESVTSLIKRCHNELIGTRGVVMSLASIRPREEKMIWCAVGNVEAVLIRADSQSIPFREYLLMRGGVVGIKLPPLHASVMPIAPGDTLIFATDGISQGYMSDQSLHESPQKLAHTICSKYSKGTDDALVLVVRYTGIGK